MKAPDTTIRTLHLGDYAQAHDLSAHSEGVGLTPSDDREEIARFLERNF